MTDARQAVLRILEQWSTLAAPPLLPEREPHSRGTRTAWEGLSPRDRAFAFDLLTSVLRWRNLLDCVIGSRLRQPVGSLDLPVRAILWLGAAQLLLQAGSSDYAAVDTAVTLSRQRRTTAKASGLVNAVLRAITRLKPVRVPVDRSKAPLERLSRRAFAVDFDTQVGFLDDIFPDPATDLDAHLAAVRSHPAVYVAHLRRIYGDECASEILLRDNLRPVITLRSDEAALDVPAAAGLAAHAEAARFLVAARGWNEALERLVRAGRLSPQDPTSAKPVQRASQFLKERPPARILDLCAGLGTKSLQLARSFPEAQVFATDVDASKLQRLEQRARAVGQANNRVIGIPELPTGAPGASEGFDLVLADVPCSNTGVMARRVQSRWRWPTLDREALCSLQLRLLTQACSLVRRGGEDGGLVVYATCSIDPAENGELVRAFLGKFPAALVAEELTIPSRTGDPAAMHDGGYFALLGVSYALR